MICDACGASIRHQAAGYVLRPFYALPEEPAAHVHERCLERFRKQHEGLWDLIPLQSREAAWFV